MRCTVSCDSSRSVSGGEPTTSDGKSQTALKSTGNFMEPEMEMGTMVWNGTINKNQLFLYTH